MTIGTALRETAYTLWRDNGRNLAKVERLLKRDHRTPVSRVTLTAWRDEYGWEDRAAQAEAAAEKLKNATNIETLLNDLIKRKEGYDKYFESLPTAKIDNQATYAYAGLLKRIAEMQQMQTAVVGFDKPRFFLENLQWQIGWLKANDPEGVTVFARNLDALTLAYKAELINAQGK
jgi:hypothetical protein